MKAAPLLVSYSSVEDYLSALPPELKTEYEGEIRDLVDRGLPPVVSARCLAILFGYSTKFVTVMREQNFRYYREFSIKKRNKNRKIQAPKVALKVIQKWFGTHLAAALPNADYIFGFVPGRSAVAAASKHCNARWVYSVDIKDFFQTTTDDVVKEALVELGYSRKASDLIVPLCCYLDNLAQGAPSSPVLSNLVMKPIDVQLHRIATEKNLTFTRYADDIVFSGIDVFPEEIKEQIKNIFVDTCWSLSEKKEHFADSTIGQRLKVHGLLVHGDKPRLTKGYRNKIRAYKHLLESNRVNDKDLQRLAGHIKYSESVDNFNGGA
jgi:RNA-directed DNA polymerase